MKRFSYKLTNGLIFSDNHFRIAIYIMFAHVKRNNLIVVCHIKCSLNKSLKLFFNGLYNKLHKNDFNITANCVTLPVIRVNRVQKDKLFCANDEHNAMVGQLMAY